jgi:hypothetical protein
MNMEKVIVQSFVVEQAGEQQLIQLLIPKDAGSITGVVVTTTARPPEGNAIGRLRLSSRKYRVFEQDIVVAEDIQDEWGVDFSFDEANNTNAAIRCLCPLAIQLPANETLIKGWYMDYSTDPSDSRPTEFQVYSLTIYLYYKTIDHEHESCSINNP